MKRTAAADVVIFGGGVAGLWILNRLRSKGLSALLFESGSLGGGQTNKSQGIIHGGLKYALQGQLTNDARAIADMPELWRQCLQGAGEIDLSGVPILSPQHYLWAPNKLTSKLGAFFASAALASSVKKLAKADYPSVFRNSAFKGEVYALDEMVIDVTLLIRELVKANQDAIFKIEPLNDEELRFDEQNQLTSATVYLSGKAIEVTAQQFIFTAGAGNEVIIKKLRGVDVAMQRRPLHMIMVKTPFNYDLYAHCLGLGPRPRITITTHHTQDGSAVWYLGGQIAEDGIKRTSAQQAREALHELRALFPWLDFSSAEVATFLVDRAESLQKSGLKPEGSSIKTIANVIIGWPTKLALAPRLAEDIMQHFAQQQLSAELFDNRELRAWPMPPLASPVWEDAFCKNVA